MRRTRRMKGGFWESVTAAWEKTKQAASNAYSSVSGATTSGATMPSSTYTPPATPTAPAYNPSVYGGKKKRTVRRKMRGGNIADNMSLTNLASQAAPFSGKTAQPHTWVGGKTRRHKRRYHKKSHIHRK